VPLASHPVKHHSCLNTTAGFFVYTGNTYGGAMVSTGSLRCWLHVKVNRLAF
jgi:hypothetical protein